MTRDAEHQTSHIVVSQALYTKYYASPKATTSPKSPKKAPANKAAAAVNKRPRLSQAAGVHHDYVARYFGSCEELMIQAIGHVGSPLNAL